MQFEDIPIDELRKAVALQYDGASAPVITALGTDKIALEIIESARENGVPLCDNPALVEILSSLEIGDEIPRALYVSVAYILGFAYSISLQSDGSSVDLDRN